MSGRRARSARAWARACLAGLLLAVGAPPAAARPPLGELVRATRAIEEWRYEDARQLVAELERSAPAEPEVRLLAGELAFLEGDYARARALLEPLDDPRVRDAVHALRPLVVATDEATRGFLRHESEHFVVSYAPGKDEVLVELAASALEAAWREIGADLGYRPPGKVRVELLPRVDDLARVSTLTAREIETSGTIALCKYNKLMVVSPRATLLGYPWLDTLGHEYGHYVIARITADRAPVWLHEGIAKFQETRWRAAPGATGLEPTLGHLLGTALRKNRLIAFDDMHPSLAKLPSQEAAATAFAQVYTLAAWAHGRAGYEGLRAILGRVRDGRSARRAVAEVLGGTWPEIEADWRRHLRTLDLKTDPVLGRRAARGVRFARGAAASDDPSAGLEQVPEEKARRLARLAGMLRTRGRLAAAAAEYEKARAAAPDDPVIGGKLARTYLDLGQPDRAIAIAAPIVALVGDDAYPQATLGVAYLRTGDAARAEEHLLAAVRISPFDPAVRCGLAEVYSMTGRTDRADRERAACRLLRE